MSTRREHARDADHPSPIAIVSGAGRGIGEATARLLHRLGYRLLLADLDETSVQGLAADLGAAASAVQADVTRPEDVERVVARAVASFGSPDALVNVVGDSRPGQKAPAMSPSEWAYLLDVNLTSAFLLCRQVIPLMESAGGGAIVNVASAGGIRGQKENPGYVAAKAGLIGLTRALAIDHAAAQIRVNAVAPGPIATPLMLRNRGEEEVRTIGRVSLANRVGQPEEIASAIAWLLGDGSSYVNGETLAVDGGSAVLV